MMYVQGCTLKFCNIQVLETTQVFINKRLAKQIRVHSSVLCCEKEQRHCMRRCKKIFKWKKQGTKQCIVCSVLPFV